ncbi:MAG: T9SS type A sorting domain-containing protein [Candidatus Cloacimonetes bacterium]|nr:T9SS type A sorting domain-containing protein [Candidatus Cloacimonadota bacterium]MCF7812883.1 T9SS type A sorting domain-containing protein [Candidatus Cloacimonadota bacterium]MCF7867095.1 T9SS type A sorting domain-containing protein [Candidatus Cloacimonadota bacterium]MCF7882585.1 T9SS type A sorting domain-containing protein [Candidatus Cloacimonadota bacterium]
MKRCIILVFLLIFTVALIAENGLTNYLPAGNDIKGKPAKTISKEDYDRNFEKDHNETNREGWVLVDSLDLEAILNNGDLLGARFDHISSQINVVSNFLDLLTSDALAALEKSPKWLRPALQNKFTQLDTDTQNELAAVINNSYDPHIDEIAFAIAHSSVQFLSSDFCYPELFDYNAMLLFVADLNLDFVQIVDYGTSTTDENYYSTAKYWKIDENGDTVEFEIPKEIYYMYIVHPKITDAISSYVDPEIVEDNNTHQNNIVAPPVGRFWRDFLFNQADMNYPVLRDELSGISVLWDESGGTTDTAINKVTNWINASMSFTSNYERPHQPVRIYRKHFGRCGEYADLTSAAARSALIPCSSVLSYSGDHTWNEFWNEGWIMWEPVNGYINIPLVYENGWGKVFGSVFEIRSDGLLLPVTDRYSEEHATITVYAEDINGNPIDGAKIILKITDPGLVYDNFGYTDEDGKYVFIVGEGRSFYARMESSIGDDPVNPDEYSLLIDNTINGEEYEYVFIADGEMPNIEYTQIPTPADPEQDYQMVFEYDVLKQIIHGDFIFDDIDDTEFYAAKDGGVVNFFMTDDLYYQIYTMGGNFETFNEILEMQSGSASFDVPTNESWYGFWDNFNNLNNPVWLSGSVKLYEYDNSSAGNDLPDNQKISLSNFPNPFNPTTTISFNVTQTSSFATIAIYNLKGQKIRTFSNLQINQSSDQQIVWNGTDDNDQPVSSGIYFVSLKTGNDTITKKMILMK